MNISDLKRSREFLAAVLGMDNLAKKCKCPFHDDGTDSLSVFTRDGVWFWKCHAGCGSGTIIDAAMKKYGVHTPKEAIAKLGEQLGQSFQPDAELTDVVLDHARAEKLIAAAHETILTRFDLQDEFLQSKRGITLDVAKKYRLGFCENLRLSGKNYTIPKTWVLPITNAAGKLIAVKLHTEGRWYFWAQKVGPKCMWAPFGTHPAAKPKHGLQTLWPPPESFKGEKLIFLCPGELKALAEISCGNAATGITGGESGIPERDVVRLRECGFAIVNIVFDDDEPKKRPGGEWVSAGREWLTKAMACCEKVGIVAVPFAAGDRIRTKTGNSVAHRPRSKTLPAYSPAALDELDDFDGFEAVFQRGMLDKQESIVESQRAAMVAELCQETGRSYWFPTSLPFAELQTLVQWEAAAVKKGLA